MQKILNECNTEDITLLGPNTVKKCMPYAPIPDNERWRIGVLMNMCDVLYHETGNFSLGLTKEEALEILDCACSS